MFDIFKSIFYLIIHENIITSVQNEDQNGLVGYPHSFLHHLLSAKRSLIVMKSTTDSCPIAGQHFPQPSTPIALFNSTPMCNYSRHLSDFLFLF